MVEAQTQFQPPLLRGGCRCGTVTYQVRDRFLYALNCHCSLCRAASGSAFRPIAAITPDDFTITAGADSLFADGDVAGFHDMHCRICGSLVYAVIADPGNRRLHIPMGTLADAPSIRPQMHIYVGSKAPWYDITDDLPQFDTLPD